MVSNNKTKQEIAKKVELINQIEMLDSSEKQVKKIR